MSCGECETKYDNGIIGYCSYCFNEIYDYQPYTVDNGDKYHKECYEIKHCYYDPFGLDE